MSLNKLEKIKFWGIVFLVLAVSILPVILIIFNSGDVGKAFGPIILIMIALPVINIVGFGISDIISNDSEKLKKTRIGSSEFWQLVNKAKDNAI